MLCSLSTAIMVRFKMPQPFISIYGIEETEVHDDDVSTQFQYNIADSIITTTNVDGGFVTTFTSMAIITTSGAAGANAGIESKSNLEYRSGHEAYAYFSAAFTGTAATNTTQFIGLFDDENGFAVGLNGTSFGVLKRNDSADAFIPQTSFNGDKLNGTDKLNFTYNRTKLNVFRIGYGWLGASIIKFQILASGGQWITFHTIKQPNSSATSSILNPMLPLRAQVIDSAGGNQLELRTASWNSGIVGMQSVVANRYFSVNNSLTVPNLVESHVLTIRNKTTFQSEPNKVNLRIAQWAGVGTDNADASIQFRLYKNATVTGTAFSDVNTDDSVTELSTVGTFVASTGLELGIIPTHSRGNGFALFMPLHVFNIVLFPGDTLTLTALSLSGNAPIIGTVAWCEGF